MGFVALLLWAVCELGFAVEVPVQFRGLTSNALSSRNESALDPVFWLIRGSERRQPAFAAMLRPIFATLASVPSSDTSDVLLGPNSIRYALHRVFVQKHGWQIRGLEPNAMPKRGFSYSNTSIVAVWLQAFLDRHHGEGMNLPDATALAAIIEEHVHEEGLRRSHRAFEHYSDQDGLVSEHDLAQLMTTIKSPIADPSTNDILTKAAELVDKIVDLSVDSIEWEEVKFYVWLRDVQFGQAYLERNLHNIFEPRRYDFGFVSRILDKIGDEHGRWQNMECHAVKAFLVELDTRGLGRVLLNDFYNAQLKAIVPAPFRFIESAAYLKHLGALDDTTDPSWPSVIVPNYINARSNCVSSKDAYDVCCIDECEALLSQIESQIMTPTATPEAIAATVANLPSYSISAPRTLSTSLLSRLNAIAEASGGRVPLHGRLFAQWLHNAYPYECAYPHAPTGEASEMLQTADAWLASDTTMSDEQLQTIVSRQRDVEPRSAADIYTLTEADLAWNDVEVSFTDLDDHNLTEAVRQRFSHAESKKARTAGFAALPAVVILVSGLISFLWWATTTLAKARRVVMPGAAISKWNKDVLFT